MEQWSPQHREFVVETFFKNGESVIVRQRKFRLHFNVPRHGRIPSRNTILLWVHNFRTTASATKKHGVSKRTVRTPNSSVRQPQSLSMAYCRSTRAMVNSIPHGLHIFRSSDHSFRHTMFLRCRSRGTEVVHPKKYRVSWQDPPVTNIKMQTKLPLCDDYRFAVFKKRLHDERSVLRAPLFHGN